ncbi:MAG: hypothetical protein K0V04_22495 [Deltaproteobacteria bacterium]|nr:hypothetical protein [Deltaproteobacteria bacterium]
MTRLAWFAAISVGVGACGPGLDEGEDTGGADVGVTTAAGASSAAPTATSTSAGESTTGASTGGGSTDEGGASTHGDVGTATDGGSEDTGPPVVRRCSDARTIAQCLAMPNCEPWTVQPLVEGPQGVCWGRVELVGCSAPIACPVSEHLCDARGTVFMHQDGCVPAWLEECSPPDVAPEPC